MAESGNGTGNFIIGTLQPAAPALLSRQSFQECIIECSIDPKRVNDECRRTAEGIEYYRFVADLTIRDQDYIGTAVARVRGNPLECMVDGRKKLCGAMGPKSLLS